MATDTTPAPEGGLNSFFGSIAQTLNDGLRYRIIDHEKAKDDRAALDAIDIKNQQLRGNTYTGANNLADVFRNFGPLQWAGLAIAGALTVGLVTGKFR